MENEKQENERAGSDWPLPKNRDWLLVRIVAMANEIGLEQGITLTVGGSFISGILISGETYLEGIASITEQGSFSGAVTADVMTSLADLYRQYKHVYDRPENAPDDYQPKPPAFIHLKDVRVISSSGTLTINGGLWRGRLSSIEGFVLGSYGSSASRD